MKIEKRNLLNEKRGGTKIFKRLKNEGNYVINKSSFIFFVAPTNPKVKVLLKDRQTE